MKPEVDRGAVESAVADNAALEKVQRLRPRLEDYVAEGIIDSVPEPDLEGQIHARIEGHEKVVRALQMNEEANRIAGWHGDDRHAKRRTEKIRGRSGEAIYVRPEDAERRERKFHRPRMSIVVPELPWKRTSPEDDAA